MERNILLGFVGHCTVELADEELGLRFPMAVLYPTTTPGKAEAVGPYQLNVARDAPVAGGPFPLVLISHGKGGSLWVYRTLAHYLACRGFVVGLPEHPFNNRNNNSWEGTISNLTARPCHLHLATNGLFGHQKLAASLQPDTVAVIGHSMGGYTGLALAGGLPTSFSWESSDGQPHAVLTTVDGRVRALVLLAPATPWFMAEGALRGVRAPILLLEAEKDEHTTHEHAQIVLNGVPDQHKIEHRVIENAGHFSFLSPFPEAMTGPAFQPSQDPPGFDRVRFHEELNAEIVAFLWRVL